MPNSWPSLRKRWPKEQDQARDKMLKSSHIRSMRTFALLLDIQASNIESAIVLTIVQLWTYRGSLRDHHFRSGVSFTSGTPGPREDSRRVSQPASAIIVPQFRLQSPFPSAP